MKKFFVLLFGLVVVILMVGCLNLEGIFPFLNNAPVIISKPGITATENNQYSYQLEVNDPEGDGLTYYLVLSPDGMNINGENGLITWTPTNNQVGIHQIIIEISDGKQSVTQSFEIEVININNPPQIFSYSPANIDIKINEGDSIKFEVQAHDIDLNTALSYQWLLNGKKVSNSTVLGNDSQSSWVYSSSYGDYSQKIVKVLASDGKLEDYIRWNITINDTTPPAQPTLNTVSSPTNISPQILFGTKEANTSIWINGIEVVHLDSSVNWSHSYNLSEGINNISITSRDTAGNESPAVTAIIILDTINPAAPTLDAVVSLTNILPQILSGTKEANTSIWINGTEVISINSDIAWSYTFDLFEGNNKISIISRDASGNESTAVTTDIVLDTIAPETPTLNAVTSPTNISPQILSGTKDTNSSILINGAGVISLNSSIDWSYSYNLSEGTNNISVTSRDTAGNESSAITAIIEYDPNIYVDAGNTTGTEDGTKTHPFNTITEGLIAVSPGKSVMVAVGTYNEQLVVNKEITLQGAGKESAFIIGLGYAGNLITITADNVTISGFNIDGKSDTDMGIYSDSSSSIEISENLIQNHQDSGIFYQRISDDYPSGIYVYNNEICLNSQNGIKVIGAGSGIIESNIIRKNNCGIKVSNNTSLEVKKNNIYNNYDSGIFCRNNSSLLIWGNEITFNGYGIRIGEQYSDTTNPDIGGGARGGIGKNNIVGNTTLKGVSNMTDHNISAKYNWWGDANGPKYPGNNSSSGDWAYWDNVNNEDGAIIFEDYLTEPQTF